MPDAASPLRQLLLDLVAALDERAIEYALIGRLALGPRGFPRGTIDVDFLVDEDEISRVRALMRERSAQVIAEGDEFSSYADGSIRADFQHARRRVSRDMLARAEPVDFDGKSIRVIQTEDLIGLKVQAYHNNPKRLQDRLDIQALISANWGKLDIDRVRSHFALFDRGTDLDDILRLVSENHG